jgi:TusA-related sulfurtransferase
MSEIKPTETLDCFGLICPVPVYLTAQKIKELKVGDILEIIATDEGVIKDIPVWAKETGNKIVGFLERDNSYVFYVQKLID